MNQTWKNDKKPNFGPDFGPFGPNMDPKKSFCVFTSTSNTTLFQAIILCNLKEN